MIVKDEEDVIGRCLDCVKDIVDEIIVVDTGSQDQTKDIVYKYTDKVYDFKWVDDFSKARNYSFSKATKDYILWVDADDIINEDNIHRFKRLKDELNDDVDVVMMKYQVGEDMIFYRERLLKRDKSFQWMNAVHEVIQVTGHIIYEDITIIHQKLKVNDPYRNLRIYEKQLENGQVFDARELFYYARELYEHAYYQKAIQQFLNFLKKEEAWIENKIEACLDLSDCLIEIGERKKALQILFHSFEYDLPRSEILCALGHLYLQDKEYHKAIYWYKLALNNKVDIQKGGFVRRDCYDFIPYIQLCVCFSCLNDQKKAYEYNELAGKIKPHDPIYLHNQQYFSKINALKA